MLKLDHITVLNEIAILKLHITNTNHRLKSKRLLDK